MSPTNEEYRQKYLTKNRLATKHRKERDDALNALRFIIDSIDSIDANDQNKPSLLAIQHARTVLLRFPRPRPPNR